MEQKQVYTGLTDEQVAESRRLHGGNVLTPPQKKSVWILFLEKFNDPIYPYIIDSAVAVGCRFRV